MSDNSYASAPKLNISAGTAVKLGFFGALGATLFSLILSALAVVVVVLLALLGFSVASLFDF